MPASAKTYAVLALDCADALGFINAQPDKGHRSESGRYFFAESRESIAGVRIERVVILEGFWERPDAIPLLNEVLLRMKREADRHDEQRLCPHCGGATLPFDAENPFGAKKSVCREPGCGLVFYDATGGAVEAAYDGTDLIGR